MATPFLPLPDQTLLADYENLTAEIDRRIKDVIRIRFSGFFQCRPGCSSCCIAFSVLPLEAAILQAAALRQDRAPSLQENRCVFLRRDGLCTIYEKRPVLCRTQGVALAYVDEESQSIEVSACHHNFAAGYHFTEGDLFFMDAYNERLAALNLQYCRQTGLQPDCRIALADIMAPCE
jgi:uncharacterized protein